MPGKVKVKILAGRNLPVMDRASDTSDAYVEVKLGNSTCKTDVYRKSLHPQWNSEWFKFEMDDEELQDEPLHIRVMDYDTYSANDAIGKVYIDLNPLLLTRESSSIMSGWIPIYDTMHGIRGEVNVLIKVELFSDLNRFRESSCGVKCFYGSGIPSGFRVQAICGFVEELVVNEDPEYQWIDKIRTPRASNEARQTLFSKLSGEVQRKIGLKALELGGNAIIGYKQCFDLEGESGLVVRGLGTAINIIRCTVDTSLHTSSPSKELLVCTPSVVDDSLVPPSSPTFKLSMSPARCNLSLTLHRASDNDTVNSGRHQRSATLGPKTLDMLEYPFLSMTQFPVGFIVHLGGVVSARSVKLLGRTSNPDEHETRDSWWTELRMEIRAHARALGCNIVLGYSETTSITDDVCVLSANGTAAVVNLHWWNSSVNQTDVADNKLETEFQAKILEGTEDGQQQLLTNPQCATCHIPYSEASVPFPVTLVKCAVCKKARVPDILFNTIQIPAGILSTGKGCLVQARVCRLKKDAKGETNAKEISDSLPFLEYELHRQLLNKLKVKGMNALFGLRVQISVGARMMLATATATGIFLTPLPSPLIPKISSGKVSEDLRIAGVQRWIQDTVHRNREFYRIRNPEQKREKLIVEKPEELPGVEDELPNLDLSSGNKDACVLEIDDSEDVDIISLLIDQSVPDGFDLFNTESIPGLENIVCNLQMFIQVWRMKIPATGFNTRQFSQMCENVIQSLFFKLRRMMPCALCNLQFSVDLAEDEEVQIITLGNTVGLGEPSEHIQDEIAVNFDGDKSPSLGEPHQKQFKYHVATTHHGIDITSSSNIPGMRIDKYLGNLNFFLIRECTTLREIGGLSGFAQGFVAEALAIVRAHVAALGGNALVAFFMNQCVLLHNPHKNQAQCLISIGGDAVKVDMHK